MPVVGRADDDRVHIVSGEDFPVVAGGEDVPVPLARGLEPAVEHVAGGHQPHAGHPERGGHVRHAHAAGPDDGQADVVGGRRATGPGLPRECAAVDGTASRS